MPPPTSSGAGAPAGEGSEALRKLRHGELTLDAYLDFRADESVRGMRGQVSEARLRMVREVMREQLENDPVLLEMLKEITGLGPQGRTPK